VSTVPPPDPERLCPIEQPFRLDFNDDRSEPRNWDADETGHGNLGRLRRRGEGRVGDARRRSAHATATRSPQLPGKGTVGIDNSARPSGSPTYPLDVFAALSADRKTLAISVINPTEARQECVLNLAGVKASGPATVFQLTAPPGAPPVTPASGMGRFGGPPATVAQSTLPQAPAAAVPMSLRARRSRMTHVANYFFSRSCAAFARKMYCDAPPIVPSFSPQRNGQSSMFSG
jgi:hypothetical protein